MASDGGSRVSGWGPLVTVNLLFGAFAGIAVAFLPAYYRSLGFSGAELGLLLSILPVFIVAAPPLWGHLADKTGRPDRVILLLALGVTAALSLLLNVRVYGAVVAAVATYGLFYSGISPVMDALMLQRVSEAGGSYSRLRFFASCGFVLCSLMFGLRVGSIGPSILYAAMGLMGLTAVASFALRTKRAKLEKKRLRDGAVIFAHRDIRFLLAACCLHWIASAPFHALMSIHILSLKLPTWVVGATFSVSVAAEACVMLVYPRISRRLAPRFVLALAFTMSGLRWLGISQTRVGWELVALALLHAFTFGLFFIAATEALARRVPDGLRASAQGMLFSVVFGVGGVTGYSLSGLLYDRLGGSKLFMLAALFELLAAGVALGMRPSNKTTQTREPRLPDPGLEA